jgi:4-amino-4-deoxy-L-arabinose transferase-like glycosyltransferase
MMKSFVRDNHDEVLFGLIGAAVLALGLGVLFFGEAAYLVFYIILAVLYAVQKLRLRRQKRSRALLDAARNKDSR